MAKQNSVQHILIVFGTRPEAIKLAPLIQVLKKNDQIFKTTICVTAQHREMLDQVLELFNIKPDYDLDLMTSNQDLSQLSNQILTGMGPVFDKVNPDLTIVQGDTTTTFLVALAAFYKKKKIAHIEAGLRTGQKYFPYPEEINRHLVSVLADYHFAPTPIAKNNLIAEGILPERIWITGNTVVDAMHLIIKKLSDPDIETFWFRYFLDKLKIDLRTYHNKVILVTAHRREIFGSGLKNICQAIKKIAAIKENHIIIYPVHLNPQVRQPVYNILGDIPNIFLTAPLEYEAFVFLMKHCRLILSDSGGIQEEAPSLGKPLILMRDQTERPEGIEAEVVKMAGSKEKNIVKETLQVLENLDSGKKISSSPLYGDGRASSRIADILLEEFKHG